VQNDFEGDRSQLGSLEQFFLTISDVPRYEQRLVSMLFRLRADTMVSETRVRVETIRDAVECIRNSNSLRGLLEVRIPTLTYASV
jgi:diaphanous 1